MSKREQITERITTLGKMPTTIAGILEVIDDPNVKPAVLAKAIAMDPALTFEILKLINSAFYGIPKEISSMAQAIVLLGLKTVKNLCLSLGVAGSLGKEVKDSRAFNLDEFWRHSLAVATLAKRYAKEKGLKPEVQNEAFLGGLLHDIGKLLLLRIVPEDYEKIVQVNQQRGIALHDLEGRFLGITHSEAGAQVAQQWKFGDGFIESILNHHEVPTEGDYRTLHLIISCANAEATRVGFGGPGSGACSSNKLDPEIVAELEMDPDRLREIADQELPAQMAEAQSFLASLKGRKTPTTAGTA